MQTPPQSARNRRRGSVASLRKAPYLTLDEDDVQLIQRVADGDSLAFERLYYRYRPRLVAYLTQRLKTPELVDEVCSEVLMVVWQKAAAFSLGARLSTWIFGIALRGECHVLQR